MLRKTLAAAFALISLGLFASQPASARTTQEELKHLNWSFEGPMGRFDQASLQRGYKVYAEVCSSCHAMNLMYYRNLCQQNGPFYDAKHPNPNDAPVCKAIAAGIQVPDIDPDTGDAIQRPATPADHFKAPLRQRGGLPRLQRRRLSAGPFGDGAGARGRPGLHLFDPVRLS